MAQEFIDAFEQEVFAALRSVAAVPMVADQTQPEAVVEAETLAIQPTEGMSRRRLLGLRDAGISEEIITPKTPSRSRLRRVLLTGVFTTTGVAAGIMYANSHHPSSKQTVVAAPTTLPETTTTLILESTTTAATVPTTETIFMPSINVTLHGPETTTSTTEVTVASTTMVATTEVPTVTVSTETTAAFDPDITMVAPEATTPAPELNPYDEQMIDCTQATTEILPGGWLSMLADHCEIPLATLVSNNQDIDPNNVLPGTVVRLHKSNSTPVLPTNPPTTNSGECPVAGDVKVLLGAGNPIRDYFAGLGFNDKQIDRLLWGTNYPEKHGLNLNQIIAGTKVCLTPSKAAILAVYTSVAALA